MGMKIVCLIRRTMQARRDYDENRDLLTPVEIAFSSDIQTYLHYLDAADIPYRFTQEGSVCHLWVRNYQQKHLVQTWHSQWIQRKLPPIGTNHEAQFAIGRLFLRTCPVVLTLIILAIIGFCIVQFDLLQPMAYLTFQDAFYVQEETGTLYSRPTSYFLQNGQWWRLFTPALLHFGLFHLIFNLIWLWELGWRIESYSHSLLIGTILTSASASAVSQFLAHPNNLFGGMSGVVYGLLGFCLTWSILRPHERMRLPQGVSVILIGWMLLSTTGLLSYLGVANVANFAHFGGLVSGTVFALIASFVWPSVYRHL